MKKILFLVIVLVSALSLQAQPPNVPADAGTSFGAKTTADNAISVEQLYDKMKTQTGAVPVKIKGTVTSVCQQMGCWIKVKSENGEMTVRMKDHSFFVPTILSGKTVVIDGVAEQKLTSVETLRDVAEDAGKSKEEVAKITHPKKEIVLQAKGVLVL